MKLKIKRTHLIVSVISLILLLIFYLVYRFIIYDYILKRVTEEREAETVIETTDSLFKIHRVVLYDSALPTKIDDTTNLENINISLFSDIAIYLDNTSSIYDLTSQNTIKNLSISNIVIEANNIDNTYLSYKNPNSFAKYTDLTNNSNEDITFTVLSDNEANNNANYSNPTFYTDCSNPITLGFINNDIVTNHAVSDNSSTISYNGKILNEANVNLAAISYKVSFTINLTTNSNEYFSCPLTLDVNLNDSEQSISNNGYRYSNFTVSGDEYKFSKKQI